MPESTTDLTRRVEDAYDRYVALDEYVTALLDAADVAGEDVAEAREHVYAVLRDRVRTSGGLKEEDTRAILQRLEDVNRSGEPEVRFAP